MTILEDFRDGRNLRIELIGRCPDLPPPRPWTMAADGGPAVWASAAASRAWQAPAPGTVAVRGRRGRGDRAELEREQEKRLRQGEKGWAGELLLGQSYLT